jgi:hypothetical protein
MKCIPVMLTLVLAACAARPPATSGAPSPSPECPVGGIRTSAQAWLHAAAQAATLARKACLASSPMHTTPRLLDPHGAAGQPLPCADRATADRLWTLTDRALSNAHDAARGRPGWITRRADHRTPRLPEALMPAWRRAETFVAPSCRQVEPGPLEQALLDLRAMEEPALESVMLQRLGCGPDLGPRPGPPTACISSAVWLSHQNTRSIAEYLAVAYGLVVDPEVRARLEHIKASAPSNVDPDSPLELELPPGLPHLTMEPRRDGGVWGVFRAAGAGAAGVPLFAARPLHDREVADDPCEGLREVPALFGFEARVDAWIEHERVGYRQGCMLRASAADADGLPLELMVAHARNWPKPARFFAAFPRAETDKYMASALIAISSARWVPWMEVREQPDSSRVIAPDAAGADPEELRRRRRVISLMAHRELRRIYATLARAHWEHVYLGKPAERDLESFAIGMTPEHPDCRAAPWRDDTAWSALPFRPQFELPFAWQLGPAKGFGVEDPDTMMLIRAVGDQDCDGVTSLHELAVTVGIHDALLASDGHYIERETE